MVLLSSNISKHSKHNNINKPNKQIHSIKQIKHILLRNIFMIGKARTRQNNDIDWSGFGPILDKIFKQIFS